tara:strand:+ start:1238 stop:1669 length:432 start_codon:yes stop_codon:yes gene_type:complete
MNIHKVLLEEISSLLKEEYTKIVHSAISYASTNEQSSRIDFLSHKYCHNKIKAIQDLYLQKLDEELDLAKEQKRLEEERIAVQKKQDAILAKKQELKERDAQASKNIEAPKMTSTSEGPISPIVKNVPEQDVSPKRGRPKKKK